MVSDQDDGNTMYDKEKKYDHPKIRTHLHLPLLDGEYPNQYLSTGV